MRAFITGGAGFIGSHLADALIARGDTVTILDNMSTGSAANIAHLEGKITVHTGDIRDAELVNKLVQDSDIVFHMAAALGVKNIMEHTIESIDRNFNGSEVVLNAATKHNKRLIIASTSEIYGKNPTQPLHEESDRVVAPHKKFAGHIQMQRLSKKLSHTLFTRPTALKSPQSASSTQSARAKQGNTEWSFLALFKPLSRTKRSSFTTTVANLESSAM
jgi:UDP-glucose 4-epimerase